MTKLLCNAERTETILFGFILISIPFYILFLLTLVINRKKEPFNSHFFLLTISLGVADLATVIHSYIFIRIPGWGCPDWYWTFFLKYGPDGSFLAFYAIALQFSLGLAQHLGVLLIALNRVTKMTLNENKYKRIWSKHVFVCALILQWLVPVLLCASMAPQRFEYHYEYGELNIDFSDTGETQTIYYSVAICINFVVNLVTCTMYVIVFSIALKQTRNRKKQENLSMNTTQHQNGGSVSIIVRKAWSQKLAYGREMKLVFSGFILCICMLVYLASLTFIAATGSFNMAFLWYIACDIFGCINPYTIIIMSREARRHFLLLLRCQQ